VQVSAWHDPRGREIVDGYGNPLRREDQFIPELAWPEDGLVRYCDRCDGRYLLPPLRRGGHHETPHSCRPERHR